MSLTEANVLAFLQANPEFVTTHAAQLLSPAPTDSTVVSFAQHQGRALQARIDTLERSQDALIACARKNEALIQHLHTLACLLLHGGDTAALVAACQQHFTDAFGLPANAVLLFDAQTTPDVSALAGKLDEPYCGPYAADTVLALFAPQPVLQSFALVALREPLGRQVFGLLAFASDDPTRFNYDMQTHYLARLGEMLSVALWRSRQA